MYIDVALYTSLTFGWIGLHYYYNEYYLNKHKLTSRVIAYNHAVLSILFSGIALKYPTNRNLDTVYYTSVSFFSPLHLSISFTVSFFFLRNARY